MSTVPKVIRPVVEIAFSPALGLQASAFTASIGINEPPQFNFSAEPLNVREDRPTRLLDAPVANQLGRLQSRFFSDVSNSTTDCTFTVKHGNQVQFTAAAKLNGGSYSWGFGPPSMPHYASGEVSALTALQWAIYEPTRLRHDRPNYLVDGLKPTKNLCAIVWHVITKMRERFKPQQISYEDPNRALAIENYLAGDTLNKKVVPIFRKILEAAPVNFDEFADAQFWSDNSTAISNTIVNCLVGSTDGLASILKICAEFGLIFVPDIAGGGKLVRVDTLLDSSAEDVILDASSSQAQVADSGFMPVRAVRVVTPVTYRMAQRPSEKERGAQSFGTDRVFVQYPPQAYSNGVVGRIETVPPPSWLAEGHRGAVPKVEAATFSDLNAVSDAIANHAKTLQASDAVAQRILTGWARMRYLQEVLSRSAIVVSAPPIGWGSVLGKNLRFKDRAGAVLFQGIVVKETRSFSGGEQPSASASFHLSYVRFAGFNPTT